MKQVVWVCLGYSTKFSPVIAVACVQEVWPLKCDSSVAVLSIYSEGMQRTFCKIRKRIQRHPPVILSFLYLGVKDIMLGIRSCYWRRGSDTQHQPAVIVPIERLPVACSCSRSLMAHSVMTHQQPVPEDLNESQSQCNDRRLNIVEHG